MAPHFHKHIRLQTRDYTKGAYFVTICTLSRAQVLGSVIGTGAAARIDLTDVGVIVEECWRAIPDHFRHASLNALQIMPDHLHAIIALGHAHGTHSIGSTQWVDATGDLGNSVRRPNGPPRGSLGAIIAAFKSETTKRVNRLNATMGHRLWQAGFHERIIREYGDEYGRIAKYIAGNPQHWR